MQRKLKKVKTSSFLLLLSFTLNVVAKNIARRTLNMSITGAF